MARESTVDPGMKAPSLAATTIRRSIIIGWVYLVLGSFWSLVIALVFALGASSSFAIGFPFFLPLFVAIGSIGGLMTFASDRTKGVFEYLISYGIRPRALFNNGLLSTAALTGVILAVALGVGLSAASARGVPITGDLGKLVALYTIPMSFATALFTVTVGMIWSSVSTPRTGFNSPIGIAPVVGIVPTSVVVLIAVILPSPEAYYVILGTVPESVDIYPTSLGWKPAP